MIGQHEPEIHFEPYAVLLILVSLTTDTEASSEGKRNVQRILDSLARQLKNKGKSQLALKLKGLPVAMGDKGATHEHKKITKAVCKYLGDYTVITTMRQQGKRSK